MSSLRLSVERVFYLQCGFASRNIHSVIVMDRAHPYSPLDCSGERPEDTLCEYKSTGTSATRPSEWIWFFLAGTGLVMLITGLVTWALIASEPNTMDEIASKTHNNVPAIQQNNKANEDDVDPALIISDCGASAAEARALGCQFDVMMSGWTPSECFNPEMMEEYMRAGAWRWYSDTNFTQEIALETVRQGKHGNIYTGPSFHFKHCIFIWAKQHWALTEQKPLDGDSYSHIHTQHCIDMVLNGDVPPGNHSAVHPGFLPCVDTRLRNS